MGETEKQKPKNKPNAFQALKAGKKRVVIAAVDAGTVSFYGFAEGVFAAHPMI